MEHNYNQLQLTSRRVRNPLALLCLYLALQMMCWRETRPGPRQRSTMWSSAGLGWGGWLELGQGRNSNLLLVLQLYSSLLSCAGVLVT